MRAAYAMRHTLAMNDGPAGRYPDAGSKGKIISSASEGIVAVDWATSRAHMPDAGTGMTYCTATFTCSPAVESDFYVDEFAMGPKSASSLHPLEGLAYCHQMWTVAVPLPVFRTWAEYAPV